VNGLLKPYYDSINYRLSPLRKKAAWGNALREKNDINLISARMAEDSSFFVKNVEIKLFSRFLMGIDFLSNSVLRRAQFFHDLFIPVFKTNDFLWGGVM
jgi:hypothetical protein